MELKLSYDIGDRVRIDDIETDGTIDAIMIETASTVSVRVAYWYEGTRRQTWMSPREFTTKCFGGDRGGKASAAGRPCTKGT